ncbi:WD_REPEATS_REGION domain-containing protein [Caerostris darwini]|uniref:WD_REPEATS_REGION domain-containing protein n=1 Tax=Caerostris darwini TaxID=1538125 RepID=A0AAV4S0C3_9ARAC|nr:WD_REPEATS_REGION domain-containing protein [Caerostris darwini]
MPTIPTCLENNFQPMNKTKSCELFVGDHKGNIYVFTFFYPRTLLFARTYSLGTQVIRYQDLKSHGNYVKCKVIKNAHDNIVDKIHYIPQKNILLSCSKLDPVNSLALRDLTTNGSRTYRHPLGVTCFDFNHTRNVLASGSKDFSVRLWTISSLEPTHVLEGHKAVIADLRIHEQRNTIVSACKEGEVRMFDMKTGRCLHTIRISLPFPLHHLQFGKSALHLPCHDSDHLLMTVNDLTTKICLDDMEGLNRRVASALALGTTGFGFESRRRHGCL